VVLTGGVSQLKGLTELATRILVCPVRIGCLFSFDGLTDEFNGPTAARTSSRFNILLPVRPLM